MQPRFERNDVARDNRAEIDMQLAQQERIEEQQPAPTDVPPQHDASYRTPLGNAIRHWGPYVITAIVVPGGIVVALMLIARRWYRGRQANAVRIAEGRVASA